MKTYKEYNLDELLDELVALCYNPVLNEAKIEEVKGEIKKRVRLLDAHSKI